MGMVSTDYSAIADSMRVVRDAMAEVSDTRASLTRRYQQIGSGWGDRKYEELGRIVLDCDRALSRMGESLLSSLEDLGRLADAVRAYEETPAGGIGIVGVPGGGGGFGGGSGSGGSGGGSGVPGPHLDPQDVNTAYQVGLSSIDGQIASYREALMERGVPEGEWLDNTLASHRAAMLEQLGYDLDVASGHGDTTMHSADAYRYPSDYGQFYDELAASFHRGQS